MDLQLGYTEALELFTKAIGFKVDSFTIMPENEGKLCLVKIPDGLRIHVIKEIRVLIPGLGLFDAKNLSEMPLPMPLEKTSRTRALVLKDIERVREGIRQCFAFVSDEKLAARALAC